MTDSIIHQCLDKKGLDQTQITTLKEGWQGASWPSSKEEVWRYSKLNWLNDSWTLIADSPVSSSYENYLSDFEIETYDNDLVSMQGKFLSSQMKGVKCLSDKTLEPKNISWSDDFFNQLGWLGLNDWAKIELTENQSLEGQWHCILDHEKSWQNLKLFIHVKKNAHLRLKVNVIAPKAVTNLSLKVTVEKGGSCQLLSWTAPESKVIIDHEVNLDERSEYRYDAMNFEANWCHERINIDVGKHANAYLSGLLLPTKNQNDHKAIKVNHQAPNGQSMQKFYSVADANGLAVFHGRAIVNQTAPKTNARQLARALMLSKSCEVYSRPELEIDIDDVQCQHGSSIGELDLKALFYLRSRGISLDEAKSMLIAGFIEEVVSGLEKKEQSWVRKRISLHGIGRENL